MHVEIKYNIVAQRREVKCNYTVASFLHFG